MLNINHLPQNTSDTQIFTVKSTADWQIWYKPKGAKLVQIMCVGGAGGGGGGRGATTAQNGGGAGASGQITNVTYPAVFLPDRLFIRVGSGGAGGSGGTTNNGSPGSAGQISYVAFAPAASFTLQSLVCIANFGNGGGAGTNTIGGVGGLSNAALTTANASYMSAGIFTSYPTMIGSRAFTNTSGSSQAALSQSFVSGGGGGGASGSIGGSITPATYILTSIASGSNTTSSFNAANLPGDSGYGLLRPIICGTGGAGGGGNSAITGSGGAGGNGHIGCGGGGGGGARTTGGRGGNGGNGIVIITTTF